MFAFTKYSLWFLFREFIFFMFCKASFIKHYTIATLYDTRREIFSRFSRNQSHQSLYFVQRSSSINKYYTRSGSLSLTFMENECGKYKWNGGEIHENWAYEPKFFGFVCEYRNTVPGNRTLLLLHLPLASGF